MEKRIYLNVLLLVLIVMNVIEITGGVDKRVTGEVITGEATQNIGMNISVIAYFPVLTILSPKNGTYLVNESILLNYSVKNEQSVWYKLDNSNNITITSNFTFNTSQGSHTLYLYANSSYGNLTAANITFFINLTKFIIYDDEYNHQPKGGQNMKVSKKGQSTDFLDYTYGEIQNLSNIILDEPNHGKIRFSQAINLTDDENFTNNILDLDTHLNISFNRIEINSSALPNFNKSATLWLYNLSFNNPRVLKNGLVCSSSECVEESYTGSALKTLKFNVTGFSVYSAEETPAGVETPVSGGGGGGRGGVSVRKDFSIDKNKIKIKLKQGETKEETLTIKNTGTQKIKIKLELELKDFVKIGEESFELNQGESKTIVLDFLARENTLPDLYIGKLIVKGDGAEKEVLIAVEVASSKSLLDIKLDIINEFKQVSAGEDILITVILYNFGEKGKVDVNLDYIIKNEEGDTILSNSETRAVETETSFVKEFQIPEDRIPGIYIFYTKATYNGEVASASEWFAIKEGAFLKTERNSLAIFLAISILVIILVFIIYELKIIKRQLKNYNLINEKVLIKEKMIKLKKQ